MQLENSELHLQKKDENITACNANVKQNDFGLSDGLGQTIEIIQGHSARFSSGTLTHPFKMHSVYTPINAQNEKEATTHQDEWVMVDYIFYSNLHPTDKYNLPTVSQCTRLSTIPNFIVGSDHLCIGATFQLPRKKSIL